MGYISRTTLQAAYDAAPTAPQLTLDGTNPIRIVQATGGAAYALELQTTTNSANIFRTRNLAGSTTFLISAGGLAYSANGSAAFPSWSFNSSMNMGFYRVGADIIGVSIGGAEAARWDATDYSLSQRLDMQSNRIVNVPLNPTASSDASSANYVEQLVFGLRRMQPIQVVATTNQTLSGNPTIDGYTLADLDGVLLTGQTDPVENGLWFVPVGGGAWARPFIFNTGRNASGTEVIIHRGTTYKNTYWMCTNTPGSDVVDTDGLTFEESAIVAHADGQIDRLTEKATPVSADIVMIEDSASSNSKKKAQLGNMIGAPWVEDEYVPTAGQVTFILSQAPKDANSVEMFVNGCIYDDDTHYTRSGVTVTWLNPFTLKTKDKVLIRYK